MIPNEHFHKQFLFERAGERQREIEKQQQLKKIPRPHNGIIKMGRISRGAFDVTHGTRLKQN